MQNEAGKRRRSARRLPDAWIALVLGASALLGGGCAIILPTVPLNAPGYGHTYRVVDPNDNPAPSGLIVLVSWYHLAGKMIHCYEIRSGEVAVPFKWGTRYGDTWWCALGTPIVGYFGMFTNPLFTDLYPVVPGHVPKGLLSCYWAQGHQDGLRPPPETIHLVPADSDREHDWLDSVSHAVADHPDSTHADRAQAKRVLDYVDNRRKMLAPRSPPPIPAHRKPAGRQSSTQAAK